MREPASMQPNDADAQNPTDTSSMNVSASEPAQQESPPPTPLFVGGFSSPPAPPSSRA